MTSDVVSETFLYADMCVPNNEKPFERQGGLASMRDSDVMTNDLM